MKQNSKPKAAPGTMKRVLQALRPYQGLILLSVLFSTAAVALTLYLPVLVGRAIDHIVGPGKVAFREIRTLLLDSATHGG